MPRLNNLEILFVATSFLLMIVLIIHFSLRKWRFKTAIRYGPIVYALGIPAAVVSIILLAGGREWSFWLSGFLCLVWAGFGYFVDYVKKIQWRNPLRWSALVPYIFLYLAMLMFYWFPLGLIWKPLWYIYGILFVLSTYLNVTSHYPAGQVTASS